MKDRVIDDFITQNKYLLAARLTSQKLFHELCRENGLTDRGSKDWRLAPAHHVTCYWKAVKHWPRDSQNLCFTLQIDEHRWTAVIVEGYVSPGHLRTKWLAVPEKIPLTAEPWRGARVGSATCQGEPVKLGETVWSGRTLLLLPECPTQGRPLQI